MAKRDVERYYQQVADQYLDMQQELKDFAKECEDGLIEPERFEQFKQMMQPLMVNYQTLSYIMFLLNRPVKKQKHEVYNKQNHKLLNGCKTQKDVVAENSDILNKLKYLIKTKN